MRTQGAHRHISTDAAVLYIAFELSKRTWKLCASDGTERSIIDLTAGDLAGLTGGIARFKRRFGLPAESEVRSCYEAGRDGFWLHRHLVTQGVTSLVIDPGSIALPPKNRRRKSDRLDAQLLLRLLLRHWGGESQVWSVVRVPSSDDEDARRPVRELERLKREQTRHRNVIRSLLATQGIDMGVCRGFMTRLESLRRWDGSPLPPALAAELRREFERYEVVHSQILELSRARKACLEKPTTVAEHKAAKLHELYGVGVVSAQTLAMEFFGWRTFSNRQQVGAAAGLVGRALLSGAKDPDLSITKAGNRPVRRVMIELAWSWLRFQPQSKLARWYAEKFAQGGSRRRRSGIVALARKLLVALWRYVEQDVTPEGARLRIEAQSAA